MAVFVLLVALLTVISYFAGLKLTGFLLLFSAMLLVVPVLNLLFLAIGQGNRLLGSSLARRPTCGFGKMETGLSSWGWWFSPRSSG